MGEKLTEPGLRGAEGGGVSEAARQADLFVKQEVMAEFLLGPEILQLPDVVINMSGQTEKTDQNVQLNKDQRMTTQDKCDETTRMSSPIEEEGALTLSQANLETELVHKCNSCDLTFQTMHMLSEHNKTHHDSEHQRQASSNQKNISDAIEYTKPVKEFKCSHCNYETAYKQNIRTHERIHTGGKPFRCQHCDLVFNQKTHLLRHEIRHTTDIKEFKCRHCNFASAYKQNLRVHETLHTGEKPFKCSQCDYATRLRESLQIHERLHTGTKFKCSSCDYSSANKRRLHDHEWKHTGQKPYQCKFCDFKTARAGSLKPHMISRHHYKP